MNLKYNILWFEDDPKIVTEDIGPEIKLFLEDLGFEYNCIHKEEGKDIDLITNEKKFDLIITDLNLEEKKLGKNIIDRIREMKIFTEVLLYSASAEEIMEVIDGNDKLVERVSFSVGIKNLSEKIQKIIELTIKKVQDVTNMRGLVIAAAIDLEIEMEEIIKTFFKINGNPDIDKKRTEILKDIHDNKLKLDTDYIEKIKKMDHSNIDLLLEEGVLTASNIYDALMSAIKIYDREYSQQLNGLKDKAQVLDINNKRENVKSLREGLNDFNKNIINLRNTLAHVKEELNTDGLPFLQNVKVGGEKIVFNNDKYIEIRKNFIQYSKTLAEIKSLVCS